MDINIAEIVKAVAQKIQEETENGGISARDVQHIVREVGQASSPTKASDKRVDNLTQNVLSDMKGNAASMGSGGYTYPLAKNHPDALWSKTGKAFSDITFEKLIQGKITHEDLKTNDQTLLMQAEIAQKAGKKQFTENLRRAAELTRVPDEEVLRIYNKLRPNRATKQELLDIANNLREQYQANQTADFIEETARVYEKRNILL